MTVPVPRARSALDHEWPIEGLELVQACPYCASTSRKVAHKDVQDWSFYTAAGRWTYWSCLECESLYLSPRPTSATIGQAYGSYYTHSDPQARTMLQSVKRRVRNEHWSRRFGADVRPRLHLPRGLGWILAPLSARIVPPFETVELRQLQPGRLADVGCGNGELLSVANQLGWSCVGIELDPVAAKVARDRGLHVVEGSYAQLSSFGILFDCIICSHVLEHVHDPLHLLATIASTLRPGGTLLLATPNATSYVRQLFGDNWRGLEAPRHLTLPAMRQLENNLGELGFSVRLGGLQRPWTAAESSRIRRRGTRLSRQDMTVARQLALRGGPPDVYLGDFCEFVCVRSASLPAPPDATRRP